MLSEPTDVANTCGKVVRIDIGRGENQFIEPLLACLRCNIAGHEVERFKQITIAHRMSNDVDVLCTDLFGYKTQKGFEVTDHWTDDVRTIGGIACDGAHGRPCVRESRPIDFQTHRQLSGTEYRVLKIGIKAVYEDYGFATA